MIDDIINLIPDEELIVHSAFSTLSETIDWGLLLSGVNLAWDYTKGENIKVAVVDTGVADHVDLTDNLLEKYDATGAGLIPDNPHATHCAGIIAACANDIGVVGVAPKAKIYSVRVLGSGGNGSIRQIIDGLTICENLDVNIINLSLGVNVEPPEELHAQIKRLYNQGKIIIAAAGNNAGAVNYPAIYDEVIAVAAMDQNQKLAKFASHGPQVDVMSPGVDVFSTGLNNEYVKMSGSSMAAPFFSGVSALLLSYSKAHPDKLQINSTEDLLKILDALCDPTTTEHYSGKLAEIGFGVPDFANNMPWKN